MKALLFLLFLISMNYAASAPLYKCNIAGSVVYSDAKCAPDAKVIKVQTDDISSESAELVALSQQTCREKFPDYFLKDPDSAKVRSVSAGTISTEEVAGTVQTVRKHLIVVNAKNSYGGYTGPKSHWCFVSLDGNRLLGAR